MPTTRGVRAILVLPALFSGVAACGGSEGSVRDRDASAKDARPLSPDAEGSAGDAASSDRAPSGDGGTRVDATSDAGPRDSATGALTESEGIDEQANDDFDSADELPIGGSIRGTIGNPVGGTFDLDVFQFEASARDIIKVSLAPDQGSTLQASLTVADSSFEYLREADGAGDVVAITRELYIDAEGAYAVFVTDLRNTEDPPANVGGPSFTYTLSLERASPLVTAITIPLARRSGAIDAEGTLPVFEFSGTAGDHVSVEVFASRLAAPSDIDTILLLEDATETSTSPVLGSNDDIDPDNDVIDSRLDLTLRRTGPHRVILDYFSIDGPDRAYELSITRAGAGAGGGLVINEIDYDNPGTDAAEFVEMYNRSTAPIPLDSLALVFVNGATGSEYHRTALSGAGASLAGGGYLVIAMSGVTVAPGALVIRETAAAQNGAPDGVLLLDTSTGSVIDALSYEGEIDAAAITGAPGTVSLVEGASTPAQDSDSAEGSLSRCPNGADTNNASTDWMFRPTPTPGTTNGCT